MSKRVFSLLLAGMFTAALSGVAQQATPKIKVVAIQQTPVVSGKQMYSTYCAVCHGTNARGNGAAASALKVPPADLTTLSQKNGGVFPAMHVATTLRSGSAHDPADMPQWGPLMRSLTPASSTSDMQMRLRVSNLTDYLKTVQR